MDGFIPRQPRRTTSKRVSMDSMRPRQRKVSEAPKPANPQEGIEFHERWTDDNQTLTIGRDELVAESLDFEDSSRHKTTKPRFWQFRKKRAQKNKQPQSRRKKIIKRTLLGILLLVVLLGGFLGWKALTNASKVFNGSVLGFFDSTQLRGEDEGRVNILLAGTSEDDGPDHGGADLTDSIMLASIDTKNNTAFTVSIPRDLWVKYGRACPSGYEGKINAAFQCGNETNFKEDGYPEGGMGLLSKLVSENFGMPIQYYGKLNYTAFKDAVDAVGGIDITVTSDDPRGVYDPNIQKKDGGPLKLQNGPQQLNGLTALALARSRNSAGGYGMGRGDFDRTTYQRAMLIALKDKALSIGVLSNPTKLGDLLDAAGNNVQTNFQTNELRRLYEISKLVKSQDIQSIDLAGDEVNLVTTDMYNGQSVVIPTAGINNFNQIKLFFKKLTSTDPLVREAATVAVLNGSGVIGQAQKRADELIAKGLDVTKVGNAPDSSVAVVVDLTSGQKNSTKEFLEKQFGVSAITDATAYPEAKNYQVDFVVIIGKQVTASQ